MTVLAQKASLTIDVTSALTSLVLDFAEGSALSFGLTNADAARVRLACEEVFLYLCDAAKTGPQITIDARNDLYRMSLRFLVKARSFDPVAFNLTARVAADDACEANMGLLIASRSVDRFSIRQGDHDGLSLSLTKDKTYPPWLDDDPRDVPSLSTFVTKEPDGETAKRFVRGALRYFGENVYPSLFRTPARLVDMLSQGGYHLLVAAGTGTEGGEVGGGIIWRPVGNGMIQFYGPYLFHQAAESAMALALVEHFLNAVAKTDAVGAYSHHTTQALPGEYFEAIGAIEYRADDGGPQSQDFLYRQLKEDGGAPMWSDKGLEPFLTRAYERLFLPRRIMPVSYAGERLSPHSVMAVQFDRPRSSVTIKPVWDGEDSSRNLADHIQMLTEDGLRNIFFELDLGLPWRAKLAPVLADNGFTPVLLLPYAGQGDIVVFQHNA